MKKNRDFIATLNNTGFSLTYTSPIDPYLQQVRVSVAKTGVNAVLLGGDVNAWNTWWGSDREDHRGEALSRMVEERRMDAEIQLNCNIKTNELQSILEDKTKRDKFLEYCKYITKKA